MIGMTAIKLLFLLYFATVAFARSPEELTNKVGCVKCHPIDDKKINVHLIPHSHDDVGWLKTVDQYYYGHRNEIQRACVECIITSVVNALAANSDRRFIQVETVYFRKWWRLQTNETQKIVKKLVENGQIEFVNGAWAMNDEACTNYQSTIDQFTLGLSTLKSIFGTCGMPRIGWQIDPFGHSREQASILVQLGYDGFFFSRLDHNDIAKRRRNKDMDFIWQGSVNLHDSVIFASIFPSGSYYSPKFMLWDYLNFGGAVVDDKKIYDYNLDVLMKEFKSLIGDYSKQVSTNNIIVTMGGDFWYQKANINFGNMDKFIRGFQNDTELNVIYSTPSCYIKAVHNATPNLTLKTDDFFPYSSTDHTYWTGYFTSRPNSKRFERIGHNILQVTKQLYAINSYNSMVKYNDNLQNLLDIMGILQHHDAITGTEKQHVADDYVKQLTRGIVQAETPLGQIISKLLSIKKHPKDQKSILELSSCLLANVSICHTSQENDKFVVAVYNPLSWSTRHYVRLPLSKGTYEVNGPEGIEVSELVPNYISVLKFGHNEGQAPSEFELVFAANDIPPMGLKLYYVVKTATSIDDKPISNRKKSVLEINKETNLLESITLNGITLNISQNFYYYESNQWQPASGAYIFRPATKKAVDLQGGVHKVYEHDGKLVYEFQQRWNSTSVDIAQSIRWYKTENTVEFDWMVGNINVRNTGKEVIIRYTIKDLQNNKTFYTDANGRETITRKLDFRPTYDYNPEDEPVSSNYYPVTSKIFLKDDKRDVRVAVLTDRSQGGTSLKEGEIELMVHRRLIVDDGKGVEEPLNEVEFKKGVYVRGTHYLLFGKAAAKNPDGKTTAAQERILAQKKLLQPWIGLANATIELDDLKKELNFKYSALKKDLPENVNIMTLQQFSKNSYLLRVEHILEKDEDPTLSNSVEIDLKTLFQHFQIIKINETTLAGTELLKDYKQKQKYSWKIVGKEEKVFEPKKDSTSTLISLTPMQIRTFVVTVGVSAEV